jgi:hypothetical protein
MRLSETVLNLKLTRTQEDLWKENELRKLKTTLLATTTVLTRRITSLGRRNSIRPSSNDLLS